MKIILHPSVQGLVRCAAIHFSGVRNSESLPALWQDIDRFTNQLAEKYENPADAAGLFKASRSLYRSIGVDPTRRRPSSEALVRRVLQGKSLYRVNTLVDAGNLCSMVFGLSIGLYDMASIRGTVVLRLGVSGEGFEGINRGRINLENRITLADEGGPFGNPTGDSDRTKISLSTTRALFVIYAPLSYPASQLEQHILFAIDVITRYCGGTASLTTILAEG